MPKLTMPLMSESASGLIGPRLVFSHRSSGNQVRFQRAQKDILTSLRLTQRSLYSDGVAVWNNLSNSEKESYKLLASDLKMTGYNYFMFLYLTHAIISFSLSYYGDRDYGLFNYGET